MATHPLTCLIDRVPVTGHEAELGDLELEVDPGGGLEAVHEDAVGLEKGPGTDLWQRDLSEAIQDPEADLVIVIIEVQLTGVVAEVARGKEIDTGVNIPGQEVVLVLEAAAGEESIQLDLKL